MNKRKRDLICNANKMSRVCLLAIYKRMSGISHFKIQRWELSTEFRWKAPKFLKIKIIVSLMNTNNYPTNSNINRAEFIYHELWEGEKKKIEIMDYSNTSFRITLKFLNSRNNNVDDINTWNLLSTIMINIWEDATVLNCTSNISFTVP